MGSPTRREGPAAPLHVVPVRRDVHRAGRAALLAYEAPSDHGPLILWERVEPDIDRAPVTFAAQAVNTTGDVPVGWPLRGTARWVVASPLRVFAPFDHRPSFRDIDDAATKLRCPGTAKLCVTSG